jgi:hypothetical protein
MGQTGSPYFALPIALAILGLACGGTASDDGASSDSAIVTQGPAQEGADDGTTAALEARIKAELLEQRLHVNSDTALTKTDGGWTTSQYAALRNPITFDERTSRRFFFLSCEYSYSATEGTTAVKLAKGESYTIKTLENVVASSKRIATSMGPTTVVSVGFDLQLVMDEATPPTNPPGVDDTEPPAESAEPAEPAESATLAGRCTLEIDRGFIQATHDLIWGSSLSFE